MSGSYAISFYGAQTYIKNGQDGSLKCSFMKQFSVGLNGFFLLFCRSDLSKTTKNREMVYLRGMKEFIISEAQTEKAVLVGLVTPEQNEQKVAEYLDELAFLADTAGVEAVKRFTQKLDYPNSVTFVGTGKLQEIKEYVVEHEIGVVIFDDELSAKQLRNIEKELQEMILDRTNLILDIFAKRAQTAHAKAQL